MINEYGCYSDTVHEPGFANVLIALVNVYNQGLNSPVCSAKMRERNIWNSLVMGLSGTRNIMAVQVALKLR